MSKDRAADKLADKFAAWNPMKEDYSNSTFNLYDCGPGANLDPKLQPAEYGRGQTHNLHPFLVFKKLPKHMTEKSLKLLCERYARVHSMSEIQRNSSHCANVYFYNISDMQAVYSALHNAYEFHVSIGRNAGQQPNKQQNWESERIDITAAIPKSASSINIEDRTVYVSGKKVPRPKCSNDLKVHFEDGCAISENDPLKYCVQQPDSHELERAGLNLTNAKTMEAIENEYQYRTGRVFINMPNKTKAFKDNKHKSSEGNYVPNQQRFSYKEQSVLKRCCIMCNAPSDICCYRCGPETTYCGKQCKDNDWDNHRKVCGKPKEFKQAILKATPTTPSNSTSNKFPKPLMPPANSTVILTAVSSPLMVFIRSNEPNEKLKVFEIVNKLQAAGKTLEPLDACPNTGQAVVAKLEKNGEYGRALVLKASDPDNIRINFLDYGNIEIVKLQDLFKIPHEFIELPRLAVPVKLKNVPKCHMTDEVRSFMYSYLRDIELTLKYNDPEDLTAENIYEVDLFDSTTSQHFNNTIAEIYKPHPPRGNDQVMTIENLKHIPMPVGADIELVVLDNSNLLVSFLSCTTRLYHTEIEQFQKDVQSYAESLEPQRYAPRPNELCIAKSSVDKKWYRGRCIEKVGDGKPTIQSIDYGTTEYVPVEDIRPYPMEFTWPIFCADFSIAGLPENLDDQLVKKLEEIFQVGATLKFDKIEQVDENFYEVTINNLMDMLKEEKLLT